MNEKQVELIWEALRLIKRRSVDPRRTIEQRMAYDSAWTMVFYALVENAECLAQYDDVILRCEDCGKFEEDGSTASSYERLSICNACENEEFFEVRGAK